MTLLCSLNFTRSRRFQRSRWKLKEKEKKKERRTESTKLTIRSGQSLLISLSDNTNNYKKKRQMSRLENLFSFFFIFLLKDMKRQLYKRNIFNDSSSKWAVFLIIIYQYDSIIVTFIYRKRKITYVEPIHMVYRFCAIRSDEIKGIIYRFLVSTKTSYIESCMRKEEEKMFSKTNRSICLQGLLNQWPD